MRRLLLGTRKGLLMLEPRHGRWEWAHEAHPAIPVSYAHVDRRTGQMWACLDHGHWGCKLHRSQDEGRTWTDLRAGLPGENCYDTVLRHALDLTGDTLAFGTTTGNLFLSEDGGDNWRCLGTFFPPIYSVRFA